MLRRIGNQYMIVEACAGNVNMSNVYSLNRTAAWLWEQIEEDGCTAEELTDRLSRTFGVDPDTALRDVERQLSEWRTFGLID